MKPFTDSSFPFTRRAALATAVALLVGASSAIAQTSSSGTSSSNQSRGATSGSSGSYNRDDRSSSQTGQSGSTYDTRSTSSRDSMSGSAPGTTSGTYGSSTGNTSSTTSRSGAYGSASGDTKLERADRRFITKAADAGQAEVQLAQLAAQRASNPDVRSFAQQLLRDHQQVNSELTKMAGNKSVKLDQDDGKGLTYRRLSRKEGSDFDEEFVEAMIEQHEDDVKLFEKASSEARDPEVRSFASKHVGHLREHLRIAQNLRQTIVPTGRTDTDVNQNQSAAGSTTEGMGTGTTPSTSGATSGSDTSGSGSAGSNPSSTTGASGSSSGSTSDTGSESDSSSQRPNN